MHGISTRAPRALAYASDTIRKYSTRCDQIDKTSQRLYKQCICSNGCVKDTCKISEIRIFKKKIMNWKLHIAIVGTEATFCDTVQNPPGAGDM